MAKSKKGSSGDPKTLDWLAHAIGQATKSAKFYVADNLPAIDPEIVVEGLGPIRFPLRPAAAKKLIACCKAAPYGKGTETLVDTSVRKTFELDPNQFRLGDAWNSAITNTIGNVAEKLGLPKDRLEAKLYKLLVYEKGGFFLAHRDSEKHDRMVASLIVVLPNPFGGGELLVRHGGAEQKLNFEFAAFGKKPSYAAFYADCEHEVKRVSRGVRLCLAYNLVLASKGEKSTGTPTTPASRISTDPLAESLSTWVAKQPNKPLVFALEHHYTERGLSLDLLKGGDRNLADLVVTAAEHADCLVHLAQVTRHLSQFADDGSYDDDYYGYGRAPRRRAIEIGEIYEDDLHGTDWVDLSGAKQSLGAIALEPEEIISSIPINDWKPTSEEYEGYTGNAGNTLDRWYHRSALVVWHRDHHFEIVASCGAAGSIPLFRSMTTKLSKTPKKRFESARADANRFARAIIANWPTQRFSFGSFNHDQSPTRAFPKALLALHDRETIALFLKKMAQQDWQLGLSPLVLPACLEFGWNAFASELKLLIKAKPEQLEPDIALRDIEWFSDLCCDSTVDPAKAALLEELGDLIVQQFCAPSAVTTPPRYRREASVAERSLPLLLKALAISGLEKNLSRVLDYVDQSPGAFDLDDCQVPALKSLIPWSRKQFGRVPARLAAWLTSVRRRLELATAKKPEPPTDWARPAQVTCKCQYCSQLNKFLADPANEVGRIAAREDHRRHLESNIHQHGCDVKSKLERKGSPYSLVLTKTIGSFERALKRYETDCQLLMALPGES